MFRGLPVCTGKSETYPGRPNAEAESFEGERQGDTAGRFGRYYFAEAAGQNLGNDLEALVLL